MRPFLDQLNTSMVGLMIPQFIEEFGKNKEIDFYMNLSHFLISKKIENAKVSGLQIDKNGNFRFQFNFSVTILVESARDALYVGWPDYQGQILSHGEEGRESALSGA